MKVRWTGTLAMALVLVMLAVGCGSPQKPEATATPGGDVVKGLAPVETIDILILESFPVQVQVRAAGNLRDGCTTLGEISQKQQGSTFAVTIGTTRPADALCTEALVPFETTIALDVVGLKAGTYTVTVNGVSGTFALSVDNVAPTG
jgi:inhibitor of cysteine peptidase